MKSNDSTTVEGGKFVYDCSDANDSKLNGERLEFGRKDFPGHLALIYFTNRILFDSLNFDFSAYRIQNKVSGHLVS